MKKTRAGHIRYKNVEEFGKAFGLTELEMQLIRYKIELIGKLKERRLSLHLSQAALARTLGTLQPAIARMEAGQVGQVSLDFLAKAAIVLGVELWIKPKAA